MKNQKGFSLAETMIYVAVMCIVMTVLIRYTLNLLNTRAKVRAMSEVEYNAALIIASLNNTANNATGIDEASSRFEADPGRLTLEGAEDITFTLTSDDGQVTRQVDDQDATILSTSRVAVKNLTFTNLTTEEDTGIIQVEFTLSYNDGGNGPYYQFEQEFQTAIRIPIDQD